ncbi:hypothetical protein PM082_020573 [Marasmius tenuissimus]|nr:hypothetical protein PM082_020573 [Marasmius tenuissimus]
MIILLLHELGDIGLPLRVALCPATGDHAILPATATLNDTMTIINGRLPPGCSGASAYRLVSLSTLPSPSSPAPTPPASSFSGLLSCSQVAQEDLYGFLYVLLTTVDYRPRSPLKPGLPSTSIYGRGARRLVCESHCDRPPSYYVDHQSCS